MNQTVTLQSKELLLELSPMRGNIFSRLEYRGENCIYLDDENYHGTERPRCGCPVLFPYMGSLKNEELTINGEIRKAGIHGIVHTNHWETEHQDDKSAVFTTHNQAEMKACFPYDFTLKSQIEVQNAQISYTTTITNDSATVMPCDIGYHPFFRISHLSNLHFQIDGRARVFDEKDLNQIQTTGLLLCGIHSLTVTDPEMHLIYQIDLDKNLPNIFLWSGQPHAFLVVEPWTSHMNAINEGASLFHIKPGQKADVAWRIQLATK